MFNFFKSNNNKKNNENNRVKSINISESVRNNNLRNTGNTGNTENTEKRSDNLKIIDINNSVRNNSRKNNNSLRIIRNDDNQTETRFEKTNNNNSSSRNNSGNMNISTSRNNNSLRITRNDDNQIEREMKPRFEQTNTNNIKNNISLTNSITINSKKYHYFLGSKVNNEVLSSLKKMQNYLRNPKFKLNDVYPLNNNNSSKFNFVLKYIYLGYLEEDILNRYMSYLNPFLLAIASKFKPIGAKGQMVVVRNKNNVVKKISLRIKDEPKYLSEIIIPYVKKYGYVPVFGESEGLGMPYIDILFFNKSNIPYKILNKKLDEVYLPKEEFIIDNLCLIKGDPIIRRKGPTSKDEKMNYIVTDKVFNFVGSF